MRGLYRHACTSRFALLLAACCLLYLPASAQQPNALAQAEPRPGISLSVATDRRVAGVNEPFYIIVRAEGSRIGTPIMPHAEGLVINRTPVQNRQSTNVQIVNGQVDQRVMREWVYEAWATVVGTLEIPPVKVNIAGQDEVSEAMTMQIQQAPAGGAPAPRPMPTPRSLFNQAPRQLQGGAQPFQGQVDSDKLVVLESSTDKKKVYEGEAFAFEVTFGYVNDNSVLVRGDQGSQLSLPSIEGVYESQPCEEERYEERAGVPYALKVFSRAMAATRPGVITIPEIAWSGRVTAPTTLGREQFRAALQTDPLTVEVVPLPERPANFGGAVGQFTFTAKLTPGPVRVGTPVDFVVTIAGEGNPDAIARPALPALDWCHVSEPVVQSEIIQCPLGFEKRFVYTLTPTVADAHRIAEMIFVYFSPEQASYQTLTTQPVEVVVQAAGDAGELVSVGGQAGAPGETAEILASDIAPLLTVSGGLRRPAVTWPVTAAGLALPPLLFAAGAVYMRRQRRFATDIGLARATRAHARSRKRLAAALRAEDPAEALFKTLTGFLGDKLNLPDQGMTSQDVRAAMQQRGYSTELISEYVKVLRTCERIRYAGGSLSPQESAALAEAAESALAHLEREGGAR